MKKVTLIITIVILCVQVVSASNWKDSLLTITRSSQHDTLRILAYEQLAANYRKSNPDSALLFNSKAIDLAKKSNITSELAEAYREYALTAQGAGKYPLAVEYYEKNKKVHQARKDNFGVAVAYNDIAVAYYYAGDYQHARINFEKAGEIKVQIGDSIGAGQSYNNTGIMYDISGEPTKALELYIKALTIYEDLRDTAMAIGTLSNIGLIYIGQKNYHEAIKIYQRQKREAKKLGDTRQYSVSLSSLGTAYDYLGEYLKAREFFLEALDLYLELGDQPLIAQGYNNLATNYELTNDDDQALEYALKSIAIKQEIGAHGKLAISQISAAKIYRKKGQHQKALALFKEALVNAERTGYVEYIIQSHKGLSMTYEGLKSYQKAYYHQLQFVALNDSVTNKENTELINEMEKKYQNEQKQQEIELLNKNNALKDVQLAKADEESKRKSIQLYGSLIVGLILLILVGVVFKSSQQRKKSNHLLQQKNQEITLQKEIVEEQHKEITDSINYAKRIQSAILPPHRVVKEYLQESFILYIPKDIVAGDFYWLESVGDKVLFAAADCTGHGVPGAMVSVVCNNGLNRSVREHGLTDPGKILDQTRDIVANEFEKSEEEVKDGMDIALCSLTGNKLEYAGANNPLWIIRKDSEEIEEIKADKQPIGHSENPVPYITHNVDLQKGDTIYIFSDGYADQFGGEKGKKMKTTNFKKLLLSIRKEDMQAQRELINSAFEQWKGDLEQLDDVCVIGVRV